VTGDELSTRRRTIAVAGHVGDTAAVARALDDPEATIREVALGAAQRLDMLDTTRLAAALLDESAIVRRRAAEVAAAHRDVDLLGALHDPDDDVLETAAWACGEHETVSDAVLDRLMHLATHADAALVRESCVAALGAIGDERGLPAILAACSDKPAIRRRAVLALAPFAGSEVDAALEKARTDRDWQVRQSAEDIAPLQDQDVQDQDVED
jgi:HEAT repeat protein